MNQLAESWVGQESFRNFSGDIQRHPESVAESSISGVSPFQFSSSWTSVDVRCMAQAAQHIASPLNYLFLLLATGNLGTNLFTPQVF